MTLLDGGIGQGMNWLVQLVHLRFQVALSFSHILTLRGTHLRQETENKQTNQEKTVELLCGIPDFWPGPNQSHFDLNLLLSLQFLARNVLLALTKKNRFVLRARMAYTTNIHAPVSKPCVVVFRAIL